MASETALDVANQALARLGELPIESAATGIPFAEDTETTDKVNALYETAILGLLSSYPWKFAQVRAALSRNPTDPATEWRYAYDLPAAKTVMVGQPLFVFNSAGLNPPVFFEYELEGAQLLTNAEVIVIEYVQRKPEAEWPGYFVSLAVEALAATLALPITENASKEEFHTRKAFGLPSENGEGGLTGVARRADERGTPSGSLLDAHDPMTAARFGGL